eukprot:TRINITY_DN147_c0_g1_i3.p2 TRINITY_DN147_c0_g1~~TRINITY_DN147_c0_g1_i3.p2  ORF type:complete len:141 (+),score=32.97 TRINITY_DN147_c0_g1_i3:1066-1488(+)
MPDFRNLFSACVVMTNLKYIGSFIFPFVVILTLSSLSQQLLCSSCTNCSSIRSGDSCSSSVRSGRNINLSNNNGGSSLSTGSIGSGISISVPLIIVITSLPASTAFCSVLNLLMFCSDSSPEIVKFTHLIISPNIWAFSW